jgi:mannan endo-1,4-beta-mannosidase
MPETDWAGRARAGVGEPAILASDLMRFSPSWVEREAPPGGFVEKLLDQAERGHLLSLLWHWNAPEGLVDCPVWPWWRGFYREGSTFDVARALEEPAGHAHALLIRDMDAIAEVLRPLAEAGVPVLWRPLHEADGGWFWWGAKGPEAFKRLWRLLYDRLTGHHGLHHLLWCVTIEDPAWYPGDDVVDVVCVDVYPEDRTDSLSGLWLDLHQAFRGRKMIALGEFPGVPDVVRMRRMGVHWAWFCSWQGELGPGRNTPQEIRRTYDVPAVVTRSALPLPKADDAPE